MAIQVVPVDKNYLLDHPAVLDRVSTLYCTIWEQDVHFGEYKQCPQCLRYYSYQQVQSGITQCTSCKAGLVNAWEADTVKSTLIQASHHHSFACALLIDESNQVYGFSWGRLYSVEEMAGLWGDSFNCLHSRNSKALFCFNLEELAVAESMRGNRLGIRLVKEVLFSPFGRYPHVLGSLSTHKDSSSVKIYTKLGYEKISEHPAGQGRICMGIPSISNVHLFN